MQSVRCHTARPWQCSPNEGPENERQIILGLKTQTSSIVEGLCSQFNFECPQCQTSTSHWLARPCELFPFALAEHFHLTQEHHFVFAFCKPKIPLVNWLDYLFGAIQMDLSGHFCPLGGGGGGHSESSLWIIVNWGRGDMGKSVLVTAHSPVHTGQTINNNFEKMFRLGRVCKRQAWCELACSSLPLICFRCVNTFTGSDPESARSQPVQPSCSS